MKKFLKLIWTIEHPMGEIWAFIIGSIVLFAFGFLNLNTALSFIIPATLFAVFILSISGLSYMWKNRKKDETTNKIK